MRNLILGGIICCLGSACTADKINLSDRPDACDALSVTYIKDIQSIVQLKCATTDCHPQGSPNGDLTTYIDVSKYAENGDIKARSIDALDMPPQGSPSLTNDELLLLECWLLDGHPE